MKFPADTKPATDLGRRAVLMSAEMLAATAALGSDEQLLSVIRHG